MWCHCQVLVSEFGDLIKIWKLFPIFLFSKRLYMVPWVLYLSYFISFIILLGVWLLSFPGYCRWKLISLILQPFLKMHFKYVFSSYKFSWFSCISHIFSGCCCCLFLKKKNLFGCAVPYLQHGVSSSLTRDWT